MTNGLTMRIKNDRIRLMNEIKEMKNVMPCDLVAFQATYPGEVTSINLILSPHFLFVGFLLWIVISTSFWRKSNID